MSRPFDKFQEENLDTKYILEVSNEQLAILFGDARLGDRIGLKEAAKKKTRTTTVELNILLLIPTIGPDLRLTV